MGVDGAIADETRRLDLDYANGEYIRGIKAYYRQRGEFLGFRVWIPATRVVFSHTANLGNFQKLYTSKGRDVAFLPDPTKAIPMSGLHIESLFPEDGSIVGFCARVVCVSLFSLFAVFYVGGV